MELDAFCIGDLAFVTAPYEMFTHSSMDIKARSPFGTTLVCSCANGSYSYIPAAEAYDYGSYESHQAYFVKGTAETLVDRYVTMLESLK